MKVPLEEGIGSPGAEGGCEPPDVCAGNHSGVLSACFFSPSISCLLPGTDRLLLFSFSFDVFNIGSHLQL